MMKQTQCPICKQKIRLEGEEEPKYFPFCSERCQLVDLGVWFSGGYTIEGAGTPTDDLADDSSEG